MLFLINLLNAVHELIGFMKVIAIFLAEIGKNYYYSDSQNLILGGKYQEKVNSYFIRSDLNMYVTFGLI